MKISFILDKICPENGSPIKLDCFNAGKIFVLNFLQEK